VLGPLVWRRQHTFDWGDRRFCQREQVLDRFRWWPVPEPVHAPERLTPLSLAAIVARCLAHGPPPEPPDIEILVD
jgi:hypothetical protein